MIFNKIGLKKINYMKINFKKVTLFAVVPLIAISTFIIIFYNVNSYFKIEKDNSTIGYVKNLDDYYTAVNSIKSETADNVDIDSELESISVQKVVSTSLKTSRATEIQKAILETTPEIINAYGIYVDNNFICAVKDKGIVNETLEEFSNNYLSVKSDVQILKGYYNNVDLVTENINDVVYDKMSSAVNTEEVYIETVTRTTSYNTIYKQNSNLPKGSSQVVKEGSNGITVTKTKVTKENGEIVFSEILSQETIQEISDCIIETGVGKSNSKYIVPVSGTLSSPFGTRSDPINDSIAFHNGLDIAAPTGTPIFAAASGTVIKASNTGDGFGNCVIIKHSDGSKTLYGHCSSLLVSVGDNVSKGQRIALVGSTGRSTGPHLHFSIIINGNYVNPQLYIKVKK